MLDPGGREGAPRAADRELGAGLEAAGHLPTASQGPGLSLWDSVLHGELES